MKIIEMRGKEAGWCSRLYQCGFTVRRCCLPTSKTISLTDMLKCSVCECVFVCVGEFL